MKDWERREGSKVDVGGMIELVDGECGELCNVDDGDG